MSFLAPLFLLGLLSIALPLWLHRMSYSDPQTRPFTATFLLRNAELTSATQHRLRYWLLLAARLLALLFVVLLFSQPAWRDTSTPGSSQEFRRIFLVVDTSLSMRADNRFDRALFAAREQLDALQIDDQVQLISMGNEVSSLSGLSSDHAELMRMLGQMEPSLGSMNYGVAMQQLDNLVRNAGGDIELILISDMQDSNRSGRFADLIPASASSLQLISIAPAPPANMRLQGTWIADKLRIEVLGERPSDQTLQIDVQVNGELIAQLELNADSTALEADLGNTRLLPGGNQIRLQLRQQDALAEDNIFYLALDRSIRQRVLILSSQPDASDVLFVETALQAIQQAGGIEFRTVHVGSLSAADLNNYDLIICNDLGALPGNLHSEIEDFVESGGQILAALGQQMINIDQVPVTGQVIRSAGSTALSASSGSGTGIQSPVPDDLDHPLFADMDMTNRIEIFRWHQIETSPNDKLLAHLTNGAPWIVERDLGAGKFILFTTPLDSIWSNLPLSSDFVALLENSLNWLSQSVAIPDSLSTGSRLVVGGDDFSQAGSGIQQVIGPDQMPMVSLAQLGGASVVELDDAGIYQIQTANSDRFVAVNTPPGESLLSPMAPDQLQRWENLATTSGPGVINPQATLTSGQTDSSRWMTLQSWLLPLVALLIFLESFAANAHLWVRRQVSQ